VPLFAVSSSSSQPHSSQSRNLELDPSCIIGLVQSRLEPDIRRRLKEKRRKDRENVAKMMMEEEHGEAQHLDDEGEDDDEERQD